MTLLTSRFAEYSSRAPIAAASLLLVDLMVPTAPMLGYWKTREGEDQGGKGAVKCLAGHSARPTFVMVYKVKRRTGND